MFLVGFEAVCARLLVLRCFSLDCGLVLLSLVLLLSVSCVDLDVCLVWG